MTVSKFIQRKNKILKDYVGIDFDLVPEDQIEDVESRFLSLDTNSLSCPYCRLYIENDCDKCPMALQHNCCHDIDSTWNKFIDYLIENDLNMFNNLLSEAYMPMKNLINEYNNSNNLIKGE